MPPEENDSKFEYAFDRPHAVGPLHRSVQEIESGAQFQVAGEWHGRGVKIKRDDFVIVPVCEYAIGRINCTLRIE